MSKEKKSKKRFFIPSALGKKFWFSLVSCLVLLYYKDSVERKHKKQMQEDVLWNLHYRPMKEK